MSIQETIRKDMFTASKEGRIDESEILKMVLAAIKNSEIEAQKELEDTEVEKVLRKETKKIADAIEMYEKMGREDLLSKEKSQLEVLNKYLPQMLSEEELTKIVKEIISDLNVSSIRDMGRVMGAVMSKVGSQADGNTVKNVVQSMLS